MIVKNQYPICEFDTNKNPIIHPTNFLTENLPKKCVITYLRKELEHFVEENKLPIIGHLNSEVFDIPIYEYSKRYRQTLHYNGALRSAGRSSST